MVSLPPLAPFPQSSWRQHLSSSEWNTLLQSWTSICRAISSLSEKDIKTALARDDSIATFLVSFAEETAEAGFTILDSHSTTLPKAVFQLISRVFTVSTPPQLFDYAFLANIARIFPRKATAPLIAQLFQRHAAALEAVLTGLKKQLIPQLEAGIKGDLKSIEARLIRLNYLLHASSDTCTLFLAGSDFLDGLIVCFRVMNPPLRKVILTTTYLCLVGLIDTEPAKWSMLSDQLYALKEAADAHKAGPLNVNDSLVPELITNTPLLKVLLRRAEDTGAATENFKKRITALEGYRKGTMVRPKRLIRRRLDKGKGKITQQEVNADIHVHKMSQISQVQDLFPDLGSGFVSKCLDEYGEDVEQVVANLLSETLPPHLANADRSESLSSHPEAGHTELAPRSTPPQVPTRHNVFDDDDFDRLAMDVSKVSFGKKPGKNADEMLKDKANAPNKSAILSALAAFDSDDDERDDTYDADDVGGTVDASNQEADAASDSNEEALFRAYQMDSKLFDRDAGTRRGNPRAKLREETGMTDEAIEGWALILVRNPQQKRRLEAKYAFSGQQAQLERTSWRASPAGSGEEGSEPDGGSSRGGRGGGRGRGQGRGRGRGGNVAGPTGEKETESARKNKEANKGSRANHNRRDARAKKMARGGFAG
ncbi:Activating signal cointegrator 1 complex subunit 2 [Fusarium oxysporum f. sp. rapae]|uniref:Activating signal cointegrator 1 complex subunit 2 n=1 Tax=Fusarium oxysporum f. sp. rapae TaxID=485398 RepID=A0A8J5PCK1_FUSOX|nr:Activating signal cointegrator 1 complex subunit 2 [Fusarium oxysporum f. sp. rapae]